MIAGRSQRGQRGSITSAYPTTSFSGSISSANCEDPTTDDVYTIGGLRWSGSNFISTNDVWYSSNAMQWNQTAGTRLFDPPRHGATCDVGHSRNIILIGGMWRRWENGSPNATETYQNDVWQSTNRGQAWTRLTMRAPFMARRDHAMQITRSDYYGVDLVYVVGGRGLVNGVLDSFNDVWVSSNGGAAWRNVVLRAQFPKRFEASVLITSQAAMLLIGGRGQTDMWASLNGGVRWTACRVIATQSVTDSSAVTLTGDERLVIASGSPRADVQLGDQSLTSASVVARYCSNTVPPEGVGLRVDSWDGSSGSDNGIDPDSGSSTTTDSSSSTLSGMAIVGIVAAVLVALAAAYGYWRWQQKNSMAGSTSDPSGLLGSTNGTVEGQTHTNALDSSLLSDTDAGHSSL